MIPAKLRYEIYNTELLAIIEAFKNWYYYLENCQYEVFVLTNYNNLRQFINTKSLSSQQVHGTQNLSCYHFHIDYRQGKANRNTDALSCWEYKNFSVSAFLANQRLYVYYPSCLCRVFESSYYLRDKYFFRLMLVLRNVPLKTTADGLYQASIRDMKLKLVELQTKDSWVRKIRAKKLCANCEDSNRILHHQDLLYPSKIIRTSLITKNYNKRPAEYFSIEKIQEVFARKYYCKTLPHYVEIHVRDYDFW